MLGNGQLLEVIKESFATYLQVGTSRSTAKLKVLHGCIANDIQEIFGEEYTVRSQGFGDGREGCVAGKYYPKKVDITVEKNGRAVAGYAIKFVMRNYSQNSNNYFENMLGETANIRSNGIPYFQIFIIFDKVPYYKKNGEFERYDVLTEHNLDKYVLLSECEPEMFAYTPDKTLIIVLHLKEKSLSYRFSDAREYAGYYDSVINDADVIGYSEQVADVFGNGAILNDYERFIVETYNIVKNKYNN